MKQQTVNLICMIRPGKEERLDIEAYGRNSADIFIVADNITAATALIPEGEKKAAEAMAEWTPKKEIEVEKPSDPVSERIKKRDAERNKRILKDFEDAKKFSEKHDNHGLRLDYIDNLFTMDPFYSIEYCHDLGFRSGFNKGKKVKKEGAAHGKR